MGASGTESFLKIFAQNFDTVAGSAVSLAYPLYASIRAVEARDGEDRRRWLMYWIIYALIALFEIAFSQLIIWLPFWPYLKLFFTSWLLIPYFDGASRVYHHFLRPQRTSSWRYNNSNDDGYNAFAFDNKTIHRANRENTLGLGSTDAGRTLYDDSYRYEDDDRY